MYKFNQHHFKRTLNNLKSRAIHGYNQVKHIAGHIDHGISIAKQVYGVLEPVLRQYNPNHGQIHQHAIKALSGYENLRNQALEVNNQINHVSHKFAGLV